jgi:acetylglutamate kinase
VFSVALPHVVAGFDFIPSSVVNNFLWLNLSMPIVIKYGGNAMTDNTIRKEVAREIHALAVEDLQPIVVHGGGPFIKAALDKANLEHHFVRGLRVTTPESLPVIEQVLTMLSKELAQEIGNAVGLTGRDSSVVQAKTFDEALGLVGRISSVNKILLTALLNAKVTPVLACIAENEAEGGVLNVNADEVAGAVAGALEIPVVFLTDIAGVLDDPSDKTSLLSELSQGDIQTRIADGRISGGMIPKVEAALEALNQGAAYAVIADGRDAATLRQAIEGRAGTRVRKAVASSQ